MVEHEDFARYPPVKSPALSRWAGLGYGQGQVGENFLLMAQYDKPGPMRRVLGPMVSPEAVRYTMLCAALGLFGACAQLASASGDVAPMSNVGALVVILGVLVFFCCGTISILPDPGISVNFRMLDDGVTALHVAAQHGSLSVARMLVAEGAAVDLADADGRTPLHHAASHMQIDREDPRPVPLHTRSTLPPLQRFALQKCAWNAEILRWTQQWQNFYWSVAQINMPRMCGTVSYCYSS